MDRLASGLTVLALALGCGPDPGSVPFLRNERCSVDCDAGVDALANPPVPLEPWDTKGAGELSGIFAVQAVIRAKVALLELESRQLYRLRLLQHGRELRQKTTLCAFQLPSVENLASLEIPPALQQLMRTRAQEETGTFLSQVAPLGASFTPRPALVLVGARLSEPLTDPLPTQEATAGSFDDDTDGQPGVTLIANTLTCDAPQELYVALRSIATMKGTVESLERISGDLEVQLDQSVLGTSHPCLELAATISVEVLPGSHFEAQRVGSERDLDGNGNVSCQEIDLAAPELFGDAWQP